MWLSLSQSGCHDYHRKVNIVRISRHKFLNLSCSLSQKLLLSTGSMINWAFLESIQLVNPSIFWHKWYKVSITGSLHIWLTFIHCLLVFIMNFLTVLENLCPCFTILIQSFFAEFVQKWAWNDNISIFFLGVHDNMEKGNWSTGIHCVLFHVEHIVWYFLRF